MTEILQEELLGIGCTPNLAEAIVHRLPQEIGNYFMPEYLPDGYTKVETYLREQKIDVKLQTAILALVSTELEAPPRLYEEVFELLLLVLEKEGVAPKVIRRCRRYVNPQGAPNPRAVTDLVKIAGRNPQLTEIIGLCSAYMLDVLKDYVE